MKRSLPTLHEIIKLQKHIMPPDIVVPLAASDNTIQAIGCQEPEQVHGQATLQFQQEEVASIFYPEFNLSNNTVLRTAWQKALLQYFNTKINNA